MMFFKRKYPFVKHKFGTISIVSLFVVVLILVFEPFGFNLYEGNKIVMAVGFGIITFIGMIFFNYILKNIIIKIVDKWIILHEVLYLVSLILIITIFNFFYSSFFLLNFNLDFTSLFHVVYYTFFLGLIPATLLVVIKYNQFLHKELNRFIDVKTEAQELEITISNQLVRNKDFKIKLNDFLFAEADKNNVKIYYVINNIVINKTIRSTITAVQSEINYANIFRCHRSFIINLNKLESAKGNSNGYQVYLKYYEKYIPVSRKYVECLKEYIY